MTKALIKDLTDPGLEMFYGDSEPPIKARLYLSTEADAYTIAGFKRVVASLRKLLIDIKHKETDIVVTSGEPVYLDHTMFVVALQYKTDQPRLLTITISQDKQKLTLH